MARQAAMAPAAKCMPMLGERRLQQCSASEASDNSCGTAHLRRVAPAPVASELLLRRRSASEASGYYSRVLLRAPCPAPRSAGHPARMAVLRDTLERQGRGSRPQGARRELAEHCEQADEDGAVMDIQKSTQRRLRLRT